MYQAATTSTTSAMIVRNGMEPSWTGAEREEVARQVGRVDAVAAGPGTLMPR